MRFRSVVCIALLAACGGDTGRSSGSPPSEDRPLAADFEEAYRIGGIEAEGGDAFTEIADLGFDARGHLHIRDETGSSTRIVGGHGFVRGGLGTTSRAAGHDRDRGSIEHVVNNTRSQGAFCE